MLTFRPPEAFEVLRGNVLLPHSSHSDNHIVVVSVFGSSHLTGRSGFKRAFRLAIDSFGSVSLFQPEDNLRIVRDLLYSKRFRNNVSSPTTTESEDPPAPPHSVTDEEAANTTTSSNGAEGNVCAGVGTGKDTTDENLEVSFSGVSLNDSVEKAVETGTGGTKPTPPDGYSGSSAGERTSCGGYSADDECTGNEENASRKDELVSLDGFYCASEGILFLHLEGAYDPKLFVNANEELLKSLQETGFVPAWSSIKSNYCKYLLLMFSLSHIMIISDVGSSFDTSYLHLFRVLDAVRLEVKPAVMKKLEEIGNLPKDWINHGRLCSPRLLCLYETEQGVQVKTPQSVLKPPMKAQKNTLEDEIYNILRKCRIVTNISANSLFAIPVSDEYVFFYDKSAQNAPCQDEPQSALFEEIVLETCMNVKNQFYKPKPAHRSVSGSSVRHLCRSEVDVTTYSEMLAKFRQFILTHTLLAHTKGFDDDSRKVAEFRHFFVLPTFDQWTAAFSALSEILLGKHDSDPTIGKGLHELQRYLDVDSVYLENQCASAFPKIYQIYQRGLPEYYPEQMHQIRLKYAINAYLSISHGPGVVPWLKKLADKCESYWKSGRQQCEVKSLFVHSCTNPIHRVPPEGSLETLPLPEFDTKLQEMEHCTGIRLTSYCNCGRRQTTRDEPFTIREANFNFYRRAARDCCDRLDCIEFPVFTPVTENKNFSLQEMIQILQNKLRNDGEKSEIGVPAIEVHSNSPSQEMETELRQENILEDGDDASEASQQADVAPHSQALVDEEIEFPDSSADENNLSRLLEVSSASCISDNSISSQSKSEYLPGMTHSKAPPGLLPLFPSWSLLCLGSSSLYNHSSGVNPRVGFLNGTNFLLPWDVMVKAEAGVSKPIPRFIRGKRLSTIGRMKPISDEFNVKVFIGLEYECHRGHRFIANDFDKVVSAQANNMGNLRDAGAKITASDMPLYYKCPCKESRDGRTMIAQMMRIHIVTPKAPVHCILQPRVQPAASPCPTFYPENNDGIELTPNSYWVLRLPYCYVGDEKAYVQPMEADLSRSNGKLLKGTFSVKAMSPAQTVIWERQNLS